MSYNYTPTAQLLNPSIFNLDNDVITYLGINVPKDLSKIYAINYLPLNKEIKADLNRWTLLPLDLHNRIDIIKMNILPRLLFFFQSIPVEVPSKEFIEWRRMFFAFIWKGLKPRVRYNTLQLTEGKGELSLPNMEHYYESARLRYYIYWCNPCYSAKWKNLDLSQLDIPLQTLLGDRNLYSSVKENLNYWTKTPLNI